MNNYLHFSAIPVYLIAGYLIYKRRELYKREGLKKISVVRAVIESNKEKIHINDAKNLFNSLDVLEKIVRANKKLSKAQEKEWKDTFTLSVKLLNVDEYDKKTLLSANKVLESSSNSYNFTLYSILLMSLAFIAQVTFIILTLTGVL